MKNFEKVFAQVSAQAPDAFASLRASNWRLAQELGLPNQKLEKWKYNRIRELQKDYNGPDFINFSSSKDLSDFIKHSSNLDSLSATLVLKLLKNSYASLIFVNGFLAEKISQIPAHLELVQKEPNLAKTKIKNQNYPSLELVTKPNHLTPLHLALLQNSFKFNLKETTQAPLVILHINSQAQNQATSTAWEVELAEGVSSEIIELELGAATNLNLILRTLTLKKDVNLKMSLYNSTPKECANHSLFNLKQHQDSNFNLHHLNLSQGWTRADIGVDLLEENAQTKAAGVFFGKERGELDLHFQAKHLAGKTYSEQLYKYILDDRATGIFNSGVFVARDSQKIDSVQRSANLLVSDRAKMNAKPELEIYADDVKCAHGASTGSLDKEALFALGARGLAPEDAKNILTLAFANQVLQEVENKDLRSLVETKIYQEIGSFSELFTEDY